MTMKTRQKVYGGVLATVALIGGWYFLNFSHKKEEKRLLDDGTTCPDTLAQTREKNLEKVSSYSFPEAEKYSKELFPNPAPDIEDVPSEPAFVTAFSSGHYFEGKSLIENVNTVARKNYPNSRFFVYDLGLTKGQRNELSSFCKCEVKLFPFGMFPDHVKTMKGYAWKPLVIQLAIKEHPFVIWMDASVRFLTSDLEPKFKDAKRYGVLASEGYAPIAMRTHPTTFSILGEEACTFRDTNEFEATFILVSASKFVSEYFMKPWVFCALTSGCMVPDRNPDKYRDCLGSKRVYFDCHRFDQSILSILLARLYSEDLSVHIMKHEFYRFCKSVETAWFLPQFMNEMIVKTFEKCF